MTQSLLSCQYPVYFLPKKTHQSSGIIVYDLRSRKFRTFLIMLNLKLETHCRRDGRSGTSRSGQFEFFPFDFTTLLIECITPNDFAIFCFPSLALILSKNQLFLDLRQLLGKQQRPTVLERPRATRERGHSEVGVISQHKQWFPPKLNLCSSLPFFCRRNGFLHIIKQTRRGGLWFLYVDSIWKLLGSIEDVKLGDLRKKSAKNFQYPVYSFVYLPMEWNTRHVSKWFLSHVEVQTSPGRLIVLFLSSKKSSKNRNGKLNYCQGFEIHAPPLNRTTPRLQQGARLPTYHFVQICLQQYSQIWNALF